MSADKWLSTVAPSTAVNYMSVMRQFANALEISPDDLLDESQGDPYFVLDLLQDYVRAKQGTAKSKRVTYDILRSFFVANRSALPQDRFKVRGDRAPVVGNLPPDEIRAVAQMASLRDRSMIMCAFCGLMGIKEVYLMNLQWDKVKPQLNQDIVRVDFPEGRKGNQQAFYTLIGGDGLQCLREYIEKVRGYGDGPIWLTRQGTPVTPHVIQGLWKTLTIRCMLRPKPQGDITARYGKNPHELRDTARSLWHQSGADGKVAEFMMGHGVDKLHYDKIYTLDPEWVKNEYRKALPHLNLLSGATAGADRINKLEAEMRQLAEILKKHNLLDYDLLHGKP